MKLLLALSLILLLPACAPLDVVKTADSINTLADTARDLKPVVDVVTEVVSADGPRDWWSIAEKAAYAVAAAAALIGGNEVRKRRKKA